MAILEQERLAVPKTRDVETLSDFGPKSGPIWLTRDTPGRRIGP